MKTTINFGDFDFLKALEVFENNGKIPEFDRYLRLTDKKMILKRPGSEALVDMNQGIENWTRCIERKEEIDNILYLSNKEIKKFDNSIFPIDLSLPAKPFKQWEHEITLPEENSVGIVFCEVGISMLYAIIGGKVYFMLFDELSAEIKKAIIRREDVNFPIRPTTKFFKYEMYSSVLAFVVLDTQNKTFFDCPVSFWPILSNQKVIDTIIKDRHIRRELETAIKYKQNEVNLSTISEEFPEWRQIWFVDNRIDFYIFLAEKLLTDIVFNSNTETVLFTEAMASQYAQRHGGSEENYVGITRILDKTWMKEIVVDRDIHVDGHMRRLHNPNTVGKDQFGNPVVGRTWVREFLKHGYHRKPQRDIEFGKEGA